jgi:hypothetical protein
LNRYFLCLLSFQGLSENKRPYNVSVAIFTWHGFSDIGSGIKLYEYCVLESLKEHSCDHKTIHRVGRQTRLEYEPSYELHQGTYLNVIYHVIVDNINNAYNLIIFVYQYIVLQ